MAVKAASATFSGEWRFQLLDSSAKVVSESNWLQGTSGTFWEPAKFPTTGNYTLLVDPWIHHTGSVNLTAYDATDLTKHDPGVYRRRGQRSRSRAPCA